MFTDSEAGSAVVEEVTKQPDQMEELAACIENNPNFFNVDHTSKTREFLQRIGSGGEFNEEEETLFEAQAKYWGTQTRKKNGGNQKSAANPGHPSVGGKEHTKLAA